MWLIDSLLDNNSAHLDLSHLRGRLTILVGNGLSQSAAYLHSISPGATQNVGWWKAVAAAAEQVRLGEHLDLNVATDLAQVNPLAIMEAIDRRNGREHLMTCLESELQQVAPCATHRLLEDLNPRHIITTNYDNILEKQFPAARVLIRDFDADDDDDPNATTIHKVHGCLSRRDHRDKRPVISESDYDECLQQMKDSHSRGTESALWKALSGPVLVVGKGLYWYDLSFLYMLRATRDCHSEAYWLCTDVPNEVRLHLDNIRITPVRVRLPSDADNGHYYAGIGLALAKIFCRDAYVTEFNKYITENNLVRAPMFVGIGLAAHNTIGFVGHPNAAEDKKIDAVVRGVGAKDFKVEFPGAGRRNRTFHSEEFPGGSALTALGVFSALAQACAPGDRQFRRSLISVVDGRDPYSLTIRKFCGRDGLGIDTDGLAADGEQTWHSTVVLHDIVCEEEGAVAVSGNARSPDGSSPVRESYEGVRFFFDRKIRRLHTNSDTVKQLRAQLANPSLRLLYMDKFLAQAGDEGEGFLVLHESAFAPLLDGKADVLYETGGAGSPRCQVEERFGKYFTVVSGSFPFFAKYILNPEERIVDNVDEFGVDAQKGPRPWWNLDFLQERRVLSRFLDGKTIGTQFKIPAHWQENAKKFLRKDDKAPRRWFVVTLHERGALGFNADSGYGIFVPIPGVGTVVNTAGAGDVFRGAFCFELAKQGTSGDVAPNTMEVLQRCLETGVKYATEKCRRFSQGGFYNDICGRTIF